MSAMKNKAIDQLNNERVLILMNKKLREQLERQANDKFGGNVSLTARKALQMFIDYYNKNQK